MSPEDADKQTQDVEKALKANLQSLSAGAKDLL